MAEPLTRIGVGMRDLTSVDIGARRGMGGHRRGWHGMLRSGDRRITWNDQQYQGQQNSFDMADYIRIHWHPRSLRLARSCDGVRLRKTTAARQAVTALLAVRESL